MRTNDPKTPLLALLRQLTAEQREQFAEDCGTRVDYLYQLAGCIRKQCRTKLAMKIEAATRLMAERTLLTTDPTPVITVAELATMCDCQPE